MSLALRAADMYYILVNMTNMRLGAFERDILVAVSVLGDNAYGLEIRREASEMCRRDFAAGAVYTTLQRLEEKRLVSSRRTEPLPIRGGRSRRVFTLTASGRRALEAEQRMDVRRWAALNVRPGEA